MKTSLWLTLLSLIAIAYGAAITPQVSHQKPFLSKEDESALVLKAGKSLESVGRLLQGDAALTKEDQEQALEVLTALTTADSALSDEDAEYILPIIVRGVVQGAIAHGVHKWLNKRG
ncbi:uncharacterized protein LOC144124770 [Amblyomma americanum]